MDRRNSCATATTPGYGNLSKGKREDGCEKSPQNEPRTPTMNEQAIRFRIGIFVFATLILLSVMITLFGGFPNYFKQVDTYTILFKDAQGVAPGTPVRRSGVRIGEVRSITLDNATGDVQVEIQVDSGYNLRKGD